MTGHFHEGTNPPAFAARYCEEDHEEFTTYVVTATVTLNYDSRDGLVTSEDGAREDMMDYLAGASVGDFDITVKTEAG